jgi:uncharacterized oxidoreductase
MKLSGNTILITGGTSGIGFELATRLVVLGNTVVVTGKNQSHLDAIRHKLPAICAIQGDVSDPAVIASLCQQVVEGFPELNILINNAGIMRKVNLHTFGSDLQDVTREAEINLNGANPNGVAVPAALEEPEERCHHRRLFRSAHIAGLLCR